jgi:archaellum component FlaG (FlaF/FlaG flagellin family)
MTSSTTSRSLLVAALLVALAVAAVGAATSTAAAQSANNSTTTSTASPSTDSSVIANVDGRVHIVGKRFNATSQTFWVRIKNTGEIGATVTITEAIDPSESEQSARSFGITRLTVDAGERTWVATDARRVGRYAAVTVVTERSISQGRGSFIREDRDDDGGLLDGQATGGQVRAAGLGTLAVSLVMVILGAWHWLAKSSDDVEDVDLGGTA